MAIDLSRPSGKVDGPWGQDFDIDYPGLDPGIRHAVKVLREKGVETFESCEGGDGHAYAEPTVRFFGNREAGWRALWAALEVSLPVQDLRRTWPVIDGEPTGPYWEMTFRPTTSADHATPVSDPVQGQ